MPFALGKTSILKISIYSVKMGEKVKRKTCTGQQTQRNGQVRPTGGTAPAHSACLLSHDTFCLIFSPFLPNISMFSRMRSSPSERHPMPSPTGMQIYDPQGHRLYLTGSERAAFRTAAEAAPREVRTYCWTLLYTGCRPSEALALTADRVDFQAAVLTFESKKKRRPGLYRAVPDPGHAPGCP